MTTSLVTIALNERNNLPTMMYSAAPAVDEYIIVDTGSLDDTPKVAKDVAAALNKPCKVTLWGPTDNFSEPRNYGLDRAQGDWILHLDADDELLKDGAALIKHITSAAAEYDEYAYCFEIWEECDNPYLALTSARLFPHKSEYKYTGHVHMEICGPNLQHALATDGPHILHRGYTTTELKIEKLKRNIKLLHLDIQDNPDDTNAMYYLAISYKDLKQEDAADYWARRALAIGGQTPWVRSTLLTCFAGQTLKVRWFQ